MKKNYKLVAVDIDGTLVNNQKEILDETLKTIHEAIDKNAIFAICTGRPYASTKRLAEKINRNIPLILYNGGAIRMSQSNEILYSQILTRKQSEDIYQIITENDGTYIFWSDEKLYTNRMNKFTEVYEKIATIKPIIVNSKEEVPFDNITKFIWLEEAETLIEYQKTILKKLEGVNYFTSNPTFLEMVHKDVSKATAMERLGNYYGIKQEEMIAIGDGFNDLPMLDYAGLSIVMENAVDEVKQHADFITLSNECDGVGYAIRKFILEEK